MAVELRLREIRTGETKVAEFATVAEAEAWLRQRPAFTEVLGPTRSSSIGAGDDDRLRAAMRPLDDEERAAKLALDQRAIEEHEHALARERAELELAEQARREALRDADPERPMTIAWERGQGLRHADPADERPIPDVVTQAVEAWVAERNQWIHPRRQTVASAELVVWPGPVPEGEERVQPGGQFEPMFGTPPGEG
ncbi:MAG: hypothetical protein H6712_24160 [Myxococcales bacterium]|nr:hypothetical protein [Myxococcales bacterium]